MKFGKLKKQWYFAAFSLTEAAIVLAVGALILSGVWGVASVVREKILAEQAYQDIQLIVEKTREYALGKAGAIPNPGQTLTETLIRAAVIPPKMIRNPAAAVLVADNAWGASVPDGSALVGGGSFQVDTIGVNNTQQFRIVLLGLAQKACAQIAALMSRHPVSGMQPVAVIPGPLPANEPFSAQQMFNGCGGLPTVGAQVTLVFNLRP